jgi:MFS transporter, DHA1 family, inner membrane transport protein
MKRQLVLLLAVCAGAGLAHIGTSAMPFQIGALMDGTHRSAAQAGIFGFIEVGALALGMILISTRADRLPTRLLGLIGCLTATVANIGLFTVASFPLQLLFAACAGLGYGTIFSATVAAAAATEMPDRIYAIANGGALLLIVAFMAAIPFGTARLGALGVFGSLALLVAGCSPFLLGLRRAGAPVRTRLSAWRTPGAAGLLFAWMMASFGTTALYAFTERIGKSIHIAQDEIAWVLSAGVFVGVAGTGAAAVLTGRIGRKLALEVGMIGSGLSCLIIGFGTSLFWFATGIFVYWIFYMFLYSYLLGTAAILDPSGRVVTLGGGLERLGYALGAAAGGVLAEHVSYSSTGVLGAVGCALGLMVGFPSLFRVLSPDHAPQRTRTSETTRP